MKVLALLALFFILPFIQCAQIIANEPTDYIIRHASSSGLGCSLRGAIMNANRDSVYDPNCPAGSGSDEIMLTTDFTFVQSTRGEEQAESGDLDITSSIIVTGSGAKRTINANSLDRIFDVKGPGPNITLTLNNLILTNGHDNGFPGQYVLAAAVRAANSSRLFMDNVDFISNFLDLSNVFEAARGSAGVLSQGFVVGSNIVWRDNVVSGLILSGSQISAAMSLEYDRHCVLQNFTLDSNRVTLSPPFQANIAATGGIGLFGDSGLYGEGGKAYNNIGITGGAFYTSSNSQELHLDMVDDIYGNSADVGGVLSHHSPHVMVLRMSDLYSIRDNRARLGGGIFGSNGILILEHFNEIRNNTATVQGGFARTTDMNFVIHYGLKITNNVAGSNGGFIWTQRSDVNITDVDEITNNVAQNQGGLIYIQNQSTSPKAFGVLVQNVTLLSNNRAEVLFTSVGGAIASYSAPVVVRDITEISFHHAYRGAFIYQKNTAVDTFTVLVHDIAIIQSNRAEISDGAGGLVYSEYANVTLSSVTGIIKNNTAHSGDGALVFVENAHALVTDISCNITDNFAFSGFIAAVSAPVVRSTATFTNFVGNIINNDGFFTGGALACAGTNTLCQIDNVVGDFIDTECGSGCVIYSEGSAILQNVVGNFERNNAHFDGGLIYANDIVVLNIDGIISTNAAEQGSGGVFFAESSLQVSGVRAITSNFAKDNGGVAFSNGTITYDKVCQTSNNQVEDGTASVAWANNTITITFSSFSNNISPQFFSRFDNVVNNPFTPLSASISITGATSTSYIGQVFPSGGSGTYSYLWNSGATGQIDSSINTAAVSVEVTDDTYCSTTAFFTIPNPIANAGPDFIACPAQRFTLGGNPTGSSGVSGINATMHYSWAPASLIVNGLSTGASLANPLGFISDSNNPSTFTVVVTDVATGLIAVDSVIVSPLPVTVNAGADQSICAGHSVTLGGSPSASSPNNYTFRYTWEPQNGLIGPTTANPIASPIQTTTYTLFVATDGCRALSAADTVTVTVNSVSSVLAIASPDEPKDSFFICLGDSITLGGDSFGVPDEIFYEWSPAEGLDDPTSAHPVASPTVTTTYTLTVYNFGRCSQDTDVVTVVVSDLSVDAGDDLLTSGLLGGVPTATGGKTPYAYAWTPSAGLTNSQLANPNARPTISTAYTVTVTDSNSCQRTDTVNVIVRNDATSGYTSLRISYLGDDEPGSLAVVKSQIQHTIAEVLNIPPLAVDVQSITELNVEYWEVNVVIYQFGPTGDDLVDELMVTFGCIPNRLPCVVDASLSLMSEIGWDYLEFIAPPEIDKSSWYKYTSLDTLSFITPDTPRVSKYTFDSSVDDDVDFASIFTSMLLDDDDDENFSDFISGNDDDDDNVFNLPSYSFAPNTYLSSLLVVETSPAALITIPLLLATIFLMLLV